MAPSAGVVHEICEGVPERDRGPGRHRAGQDSQRACSTKDPRAGGHADHEVLLGHRRARADLAPAKPVPAATGR